MLQTTIPPTRLMLGPHPFAGLRARFAESILYPARRPPPEWGGVIEITDPESLPALGEFSDEVLDEWLAYEDSRHQEFDPTLGFPGEGPGPTSLATYVDVPLFERKETLGGIEIVKGEAVRPSQPVQGTSTATDKPAKGKPKSKGGSREGSKPKSKAKGQPQDKRNKGLRGGGTRGGKKSAAVAKSLQQDDEKRQGEEDGEGGLEPRQPDAKASGGDMSGKCFQCGKAGHKKAQCKSTEPSVPVEEKPAETAEERAAKEQLRIDSIHEDLSAKCETMWLTKDPKSPTDRKVVLQALAVIARKNKLTGDVTDIILKINAETLRQSVGARRRYARDLTRSHNEEYGISSFARHFGRYMRLNDLGRVVGTEIDRMNQWEAKEPLSRSEHTHVPAYFLALQIHCIVLPMIEEGLKTLGHYLLDLTKITHTSGSALVMLSVFLPCLLITAIETSASRRVGRWLVLEWIFRLAAHFVLGLLDWSAASMLHMVYNSTVMFTHIHVGTPIDWLLSIGVVTRLLVASWATTVASTCLESHKVKLVPVCTQFTYRPSDTVCVDNAFGYSSYLDIENINRLVYRSCSHNEVVSAHARVGKAVPVAEPETASRVLKHWKRTMCDLRSALLEPLYQVGNLLSLEEWCSRFPPRKRDDFLQLVRDKFEWPKFICSAFIKREVSFVPDFMDAVYKDPRMIQGCERELSLLVGPSVLAATKQWKHTFAPRAYTRLEVMGRKRHVRYMCGDSAEAVGKAFDDSFAFVERTMDSDDFLVILEDDQSRFDLHMREGAFHCLNENYKRMFSGKVASLLRRQKKSKSRTNLGTKFTIDYTMQSGMPDTSIGDSIVNATMKYKIHGPGRLWISIIMGDDSITLTTRKTIDAMGGVESIKKQYSAFGMEIEVTTSDEKLACEMCSSRFYPTLEGSVLFPKIGRILSKCLVDIQKRSALESLEWLRGVAAGLECYGSIDPLLASLAKAIRRHVGGGKGLSERSAYNFYNSSTTKTSWVDVCVYYDHHYGLNEAQVIAACHTLSAVQLGTTCCDSVIAMICKADT